MAEFRADNVTDWAAALTYYGVLSIFPALIALISVVGLLGSSATNSLLTNLQAFTPGPAKDILTNAVTGLSKNRSAGGVMFVVGLGVALWSASGYVAAFMRAANAIWDAPEGRPIWKTLPVRSELLSSPSSSLRSARWQSSSPGRSHSESETCWGWEVPP